MSARWLARPAALFIALELAVHGIAWACSCAEPGSVAEEAAASDLVVFGEVVSVREPGLGCSQSSADPVQVRIDVLEGFVGAAAGDEVEVETAREGASCGVGFEEGQTWLVYAQGGSASLCSRTRRAEAGDPELVELADL